VPYGHSHATKEIIFTHPECKLITVTGCYPAQKKKKSGQNLRNYPLQIFPIETGILGTS